MAAQVPKKGRGRPRKDPAAASSSQGSAASPPSYPKRGRGRPRKPDSETGKASKNNSAKQPAGDSKVSVHITQQQQQPQLQARGRGRPRKQPVDSLAAKQKPQEIVKTPVSAGPSKRKHRDNDDIDEEDEDGDFQLVLPVTGGKSSRKRSQQPTGVISGMKGKKTKIAEDEEIDIENVDEPESEDQENRRESIESEERQHEEEEEEGDVSENMDQNSDNLQDHPTAFTQDMLPHLKAVLARYLLNWTEWTLPLASPQKRVVRSPDLKNRILHEKLKVGENFELNEKIDDMISAWMPDAESDEPYFKFLLQCISACEKISSNDIDNESKSEFCQYLINIFDESPFDKKSKAFYKLRIELLTFTYFFVSDDISPEEHFDIQTENLLSPLQQIHIQDLKIRRNHIKKLNSDEEKTKLIDSSSALFSLYLTSAAKWLEEPKQKRNHFTTPVIESGTSIEDIHQQIEKIQLNARTFSTHFWVSPLPMTKSKPSSRSASPRPLSSREKSSSNTPSQTPQRSTVLSSAKAATSAANKTRSSLLNRQENRATLTWSGKSKKEMAQEEAVRLRKLKAKGDVYDFPAGESEEEGDENERDSNEDEYEPEDDNVAEESSLEDEVDAESDEAGFDSSTRKENNAPAPEFLTQVSPKFRGPRSRCLWTDQETEALERAVTEHGAKWAMIKKRYGGPGQILAGRNAMSLRDKAKNECMRLKKAGLPTGVFGRVIEGPY